MCNKCETNEDMQNCIKCSRERETKKGIRKKVVKEKTSEKGSKKKESSSPPSSSSF
jgi:hypothetical protein